MKVLIAEDDFISRKLLNTLLAPFGEVDIAANGKEAFTAVKMAIENNHPYDLICLDILMPELDGIMALKKISGFGILFIFREKAILSKTFIWG